MVLAYTLVLALSALSAQAVSVSDACKQIADAISSSSDVYYPGSTQYDADIYHWSIASTQNATCSVEPGTVEDVSAIVKIVGETGVPFAVKGGGHATNQNFSSTTGVQIAMSRFKDVVLSDDKSTVAVGPGLIWDDVYGALNGTGVNVVGGRVPGVGVAGFVLGGGYSYLTSQYGLTLDNVAAFDLVLPNGTFTTVTPADSDLWFALRGAGAGNFGVVTTFHLITHPQGQVWGGIIGIDGSNFDLITAAAARFSLNNTDKKAAMIPAYQYGAGAAFANIVLFYDGPTPPAGIFDDWLAIPTTSSDLATRDFASFIQALSALAPIAPATHAYFASVMLQDYPVALLDFFKERTLALGPSLAQNDSDFFLSLYVEPFDTSYLSYNDAPASWPDSRTRGLQPTDVYFSWKDGSLEEFFLDAMRQTVVDIRNKADELGQDVGDAVEYPNYALSSTPSVKVYGEDNLKRLQAVQAVIDPKKVFAQTGGFKIDV
ncbi:unnamed protein product [Peniophora sp. CBMAI 1063]|nr:unnamed protein product [Peniophora sp. CBMAI 1063]